jgi:hypothetical protein
VLLIALIALVVLGTGIVFPLRQRVWRLSLAAQEQVTIGRQLHVLDPVCSVDLAGIPPDDRAPDEGFGGRFSCFLMLRAVGLGYAPPDLRADSVWFVLGPLAYGTDVVADEYSRFRDLPDRRIWVVRTGPDWLQPFPVTVFLRLYDSRGRTYVVRRSGVRVKTAG